MLSKYLTSYIGENTDCYYKVCVVFSVFLDGTITIDCANYCLLVLKSISFKEREVNMNEETRYANQLRSEARSENDSRLPYEPPTLRKHGKVNNATQAVFPADDIDGPLGFADLS